MKRNILLVAALLLLIVQFFQIDKTQKAVHPALDFATLTNPPKDVLAVLEKACYDCHSHKTEYPWYASVQPLGWWLRSHVRGAQQHLNFSEFGHLDSADKNAILREAAKEIEMGEMPMKSYVKMHSEAKLTEAEKAKVIAWLRNPLPSDLSMGGE